MPGEAVRLALVEVAAQPDVPVGEREDRLGAGQDVEVQAGSRTVHGSTSKAVDGWRSSPVRRLGAVRRTAAVVSSPSARAVGEVVDDDVRAVLARERVGLADRSTPTTSPNAPARPASTPASASSKTAACAGATPERPAPARNVSGRRLAGQVLRSRDTPSTRASKRSSCR